MTKVVLINAIYFKDRWRWDRKFSHSNTKDEKFYFTPDKIKKAKMMKQDSKEWQYSDTKTFQFLTLDYQQCDLSMRIILPRKRFGLVYVFTFIIVSV